MMWLWVIGFLGRLALLLDGMSLSEDGICSEYLMLGVSGTEEGNGILDLFFHDSLGCWQFASLTVIWLLAGEEDIMFKWMFLVI